MVSAIVVIVAAPFLAAHAWAGRVIERHRVEIAEERSRRPGIRTSRPVVTGDDPEEGNAWAAYVPAMRALWAIPGEDHEALPKPYEGYRSFDPKLVGPIHERLLPEIRRIASGARRIDVTPPKAEIDLGEFISASRVLAGLATYRALTGHQREGLEMAVSLLVLSSDYAHVGHLLMAGISETNGIEVVRLILEKPDLAASDFERLAGNLDRLEPLRPHPADAYRGTCFSLREGLVDEEWCIEVEDYNSQVMYRRARYFWSTRIARAAALEEFARVLGATEETMRKPVSEWLNGSRALKNRPDQDQNPYMEALGPYPGGAIDRLAEFELNWALMRTAVGIAWYQVEHGKPLASLEDLVPKYVEDTPRCPLTGELLRWKDGLLWSIGTDGVDDGGRPVEGDGDMSEKPSGDVTWKVGGNRE